MGISFKLDAKEFSVKVDGLSMGPIQAELKKYRELHKQNLRKALPTSLEQCAANMQLDLLHLVMEQIKLRRMALSSGNEEKAPAPPVQVHNMMANMHKSVINELFKENESDALEIKKDIKRLKAIKSPTSLDKAHLLRLVDQLKHLEDQHARLLKS